MSIKIEYREDRKRWQVTYYLNGRRARPLFQEKAEAKNFARKIHLGLAPEDRDSITVDEAGRKYYESVSPRKNPKSKSNDKRYINLHFHFMTYERGIERLSSVQLEDMEAFRDWLIVQTEYDDKPMRMGPSTINRCLRVMKNLYKRHVQWKNIQASPCLYLDFLEVEEKQRRAMTGDEFVLALGKTEDWFKPVMQFVYLTGAPASCIERLVWSDINFEQRRFSILRKKGKQAKWKRVPMFMSDAVFALFVMLRNQMPGLEGAVFRDRQGRKLLADRITKIANAVIKEAGIEDVTLYCLRHALATDLTTANVATELVRQAMGHSSIATTQRYANKADLKSVVGAIESVRGGSLVANAGFRLRQDGEGK